MNKQLKKQRREAFEAWCVRQLDIGYSANMERDGKGYHNALTDAAWVAFKGGFKEAVKALEETAEEIWEHDRLKEIEKRVQAPADPEKKALPAYATLEVWDGIFYEEYGTAIDYRATAEEAKECAEVKGGTVHYEPTSKSDKVPWAVRVKEERV